MSLSAVESSKRNHPGTRKEAKIYVHRHGRGMHMKKTALGLLAVVGTAGVAFGQPPGGGHWQGPPPEAIQACEGKSQGDAVQFQTPRGDMITGTCREMQGQLVAVPQR